MVLRSGLARELPAPSQDVSRIHQIRDYLFPLASLVVPLFALNPLQNVPFRDDWTYAWSVENLLNNHTLKILDWSTHVNLAQILWGALFCLPFGFSFTALRLSTWLLAVLGLAGLYFLMKEVGVSERDSLFAAGLLACSPLYVLLSFSFMTDVPAMAFGIWSVFCLIKGMKQSSVGWLLLGSVLSMMSISTRLTGLAIPLGFILFTILQANSRWKKWPAMLIGGITPILFAVGLIVWHSYHIEYRADLTWLIGSPQNRAQNLPFAISRFHQWLLTTIGYTVAPLGFFLAPVAVGCARWLHRTKVLVVFGLVAGVFIITHLSGFASPLNGKATWSDLVNLGGTHVLVPSPGDYALPKAWDVVITLAGMLLFCFSVGPILSAVSTLPLRILACQLVTQFLFTVVLWLWSSRYILALLPPLLGLLLSAVPIRRPRLAVAFLGLFALVSFGVLHDELEYNRALWGGVDYLQGLGAPIPRINGGYTVDGWLQYAHRENAKTNSSGDVEVELVNVNSGDYDYKISNESEAGWVNLKEFPYASWLTGSGQIYVLARPNVKNAP